MEVMHLYSLWQNMAFIPSMLAIIFMILTMNSSGGQSRAFSVGQSTWVKPQSSTCLLGSTGSQLPVPCFLVPSVWAECEGGWRS